MKPNSAHTMLATGFVVLVGLLALLVSTGCGGGSTTTNSTRGTGPVAASVSGTIAVGTAPSGMAVDAIANKIYVANFGNQTSGRWPVCQATSSNVTLIDGATQSTSTIDIGVLGNPLPSDANVLAVVMSPGSPTVYEAFQVPGPSLTNDCFNYENFLVAINGPQPNAAFCATCQLGAIAVNPTTSTVYLGNYIGVLGRVVNAYIAVFPPGSNFSNQVQVHLTGAPTALAVNSTTDKIYVAVGTEIDVVDGTTNSLTKVADVGTGGADSLAVNPTTNTIYVANSQSNNVTVIDGATDSVTATIAVGTAPSGLAVDSETNFIYVANAGDSQNGDPGSITVIDGTKQTTDTLTNSKAKNPSAVAVNSTTNKIYVANSGTNNVTVIDGAHN